MTTTDKVLVQSFSEVFEKIDQGKIKQSVDEKGLDGFIEDCAQLSATTEVTVDLGDIAAIAFEIPVDAITSVIQQIRVALAVMYARNGLHNLSCNELMSIIAVSF